VIIKTFVIRTIVNKESKSDFVIITLKKKKYIYQLSSLLLHT